MNLMISEKTLTRNTVIGILLRRSLNITQQGVLSLRIINILVMAAMLTSLIEPRVTLAVSGSEQGSKGRIAIEPSTISVPCNRSANAHVLLANSVTNDCGLFGNFGEDARSVSYAFEPAVEHLSVSAPYMCDSDGNGHGRVCAHIQVTSDSILPGKYKLVARGTSYCGGEVIWEGDVTIEKNSEGCLTPTCSPIGDSRSGNGSISSRISMGKFAFGKSVGQISLHEKYPKNLLCTPACLDFLYHDSTNRQVFATTNGQDITYTLATNTFVEVVTTSAGLRQVRAPEGLANVITNSTYKYSIEIHPLSNVGTNKNVDGTYPVSGTPLSIITVENLDGGSSTNKLRITDGDGMIADYEWQTNGWELVSGGGLRRERKMTISTNNLRTTTTEIFGASGMERCIVRHYQTFGFGERMVSSVDGMGANIRSNYFDYYTNTSLVTTGLTRLIARAEGSWELFDYGTNGLHTNTFFAFLNEAPTTNASLVKTVRYQYGTNAVPGAGDAGRKYASRPRAYIEYVQGHETARKYKLYLPYEKREIECVNPGALWSDSSNLVTTYKWYNSGANSNMLKSIEMPDGTMEIHDYGFYAETNAVAVMYGTNQFFRTNILAKGTPDGAKTSITDGKRTITVWGRVGEKLSFTEIDIASSLTNYSEYYSQYDSYSRPRKTTYIDGSYSWTDHGCCGPVTVTNRDGSVKIYYQNALKHQAAVKENGIISTNILDAGGRILKTVRIGTNSSQIVQGTFGYDIYGNQVAATNALGQKTIRVEAIASYQRTVTTTYSDGSTRIEEFYRDGQLAKVTGTAVHPVRYEHGTEQDGGIWRLYTKEIKLDTAGSDTSEWTKTYTDMLGRQYKTVFSDGATRQSSYNIKGQLVKQVDPDGVTTLYAYNAKGEQSVVATDVNRDGIVNTNGTDRIQQTIRSVVNNGSANVQRAATYIWSTNNVATSNLVAVADTSVDGLISWNSRFGLTNQSRTKYAGSGNRYATNTAPDGSFSISYYANGLLQSVTRKDSGGTQLSQVSYFYDEHGRQYAATDARNGTTFYTYNDADRVVTTITPPPGNGASAQTTSYEHDWAGRVTRTVLPDGTSVTNEYHLTGELKKTYGSRNYPVQYGYDAQGRRTNMITWKNFAADSGKATTVWKYDNYRGFLTNKVYDDGKGPFYTYTPAGRMRTRAWARGVVTTYQTNAVGEVYATTYSDSTPAVTNNFDRLGRSTNIIDGASSRFLVYNATGQLLRETNSSGTMIGANLRFVYDQYLRRTNHAWYATNTSLLSQSFVFDGASRITNVSDGTYQAGYSYLANSPLISQVTYRSNTTTRMTTARTYDSLNRLQNITSTPSASGESTVAFNYGYNDANQRTRVNMDDGSFWIYEYDKLGQVISGKRYWSDWTPVAGQQYEYAFDDIGNRSSTKSGGDSGGAALRAAAYTANNLNQYSSRDVPAYLNVLGIANANASVIVNSNSTYRKGEYFQKELSVSNTNAVWQAVTNIASLTGTNQTNTGNLFLPKTAESYTYDLDGNLTSDGRWTNKWDAENRLIDMSSHSSGPSGSRKSLQFAYDSQGRRYSKVVSNWTGSAWTRVLHEKFVYDGWNLLGAIDGTNNAIIRSLLWGLDLSGSLQGAGGVGGLICFKQHSGSLAGSHFAAYDGNGNVMALVDGKTGSTSARYEYDPFGQTIRASGTMATVNPVRFSSKTVDDETDMAYYGYRYLNPNAGRWLNRDPKDEAGGKHLYCFIQNDPPMHFDPDGRVAVSLQSLQINKCGGFNAVFVFSLQPENPEGYLVQEVNTTESVFDCNGRLQPVPSDHYWEAWTVPAAPQGGTSSMTDTASRNETFGSNGNGSYTGKIRFFPKSATGELNTQNGGWGTGTIPAAIGLLTTTTQPTWWNNPLTEPEASRSVSFDYKCCCPFLYNTVTTNPSR